MVFAWDSFTLDVDQHRLTGPDGDIHVEPQAFDLLALLVELRDRVVPKSELLESVWGDQFVSESALTTRIKQVRQALGDDGRTQKYVRNVHGRGYQFVGEIDSSSPVVVAAAPLGSAPPPEPEDLRLALDIAVDAEFPFVGRHDELTAARQALAAGQNSEAQILIGGSPGAGKSRLAVELLEEAAAAGSFVCAGRCEINITSGLQAVRDAFAQLAAVHPGRVAGWAQGIEGPLLSLIPSLVTILPNDPMTVDAYAGIDVFVTAFERVSADGPVVLLIDDLQWSDDPTRTFIGRLHRRLRGRPITTVTTFRSARADLPDEVHQWLQQQRRRQGVADLALGDLDADDAQRLVAAVVGDSDGQEQLVAVTGGHPLFLTESLRDLQLGQTTSGSVGELIASRVERQPDEVQRIVRAGALLGTEFPFSAAAAAAELDVEVALAAIDTAVEAELLHETSSLSRFRFSHQLVPQAIADSLSKAKRAALHRSCAAALIADQADEVEIAFHTLGAVPLVSIDEAIGQARSAAHRAVDNNQFDRALRLLGRVLETEPQTRTKAEVLLEMAEITNRKGLPAEAIGRLELVASIARANSWPDLFVAAALAHWSQSPFRYPRDGATLELLAEADELLGDTRSIEKARVMAKTAVFNVFRQPLSQRDDATRLALEMGEEFDPGPADRVELLEARHITLSCPAGAEQLPALDREIENCRRSSAQNYFMDAAAPETAAFMLARGDDLRRLTAGDEDRIENQPIAEWRDLKIRSTLASFNGLFDEARDFGDRASEIGQAFWGESSVALHGFTHFFVDLISGQWTRSLELLDLLVQFDGSPVFGGPLALAKLQAGDDAGAAQMIDSLQPHRWRGFGEHILGGNALVACAELALTVDDDKLAEAAEMALLPFRGLVLGVPWGAASLAAADPLARLAERRGDEASAAEHWEKAAELYRSLDAPALAARVV